MTEWSEKHTRIANDIDSLISDIDWLNRELRAESAHGGSDQHREKDLKAQLDTANEALAEGRAELRRMIDDAS